MLVIDLQLGIEGSKHSRLFRSHADERICQSRRICHKGRPLIVIEIGLTYLVSARRPISTYV